MYGNPDGNLNRVLLQGGYPTPDPNDGQDSFSILLSLGVLVVVVVGILVAVV